MSDLWKQCSNHLQNELTPHEYNTWILPLHVTIINKTIRVLAPNKIIQDQVKKQYFENICAIINSVADDDSLKIILSIGSKPIKPIITAETKQNNTEHSVVSNLNQDLIFETFVEGKSNQFARAASRLIAANPGKENNPLYIYGGVGLGKTHLMHAVGNYMLQNNPEQKILYITAERFVRDMVNALQNNTIDGFKKYYRSLNSLLIDDIQFLANKERSQEEFFHTFNTLVEDKQQIIMTCDRYPKEVVGLEDRLKSRFGSGLTVSVQPADYETRVAILINKAQQLGAHLPDEVAYFIAEIIQSNIRELEGALNRVIYNAKYLQCNIQLEQAKDVLHDLIKIQNKDITIENIQKKVCEYFNIKLNDLLSSKRSRSLARPRQIAMTLCKELTNHSYPEIGDNFGGKDHSTVIHACKRIAQLKNEDRKTEEDYNNLSRIIAT